MYAASCANLERNIPEILKGARQFLPWKANRKGKKIPLRPDGRYGDFRDAGTWMRFGEAVNMVRREEAFGVGLALTDQLVPGYNTITGLVALDLDAKHCDGVEPGQIPDELRAYAGILNTYTELSPSLKGLRGLAFGTIPTDKSCMTRQLELPGAELSLFRSGWVTLSGLAVGGAPATIEHRQEELDELVNLLWTSKEVVARAEHQQQAGKVLEDLQPGDYIIDWSRTASQEDVDQLIRGLNRTPEQIARMGATWAMRRGFGNAETSTDRSMYTKILLREAIALAPYCGWSLQTVVDLVITFAKAHRLSASALHSARVKSQIADALAYIGGRSRDPERYGIAGRDNDNHDGVHIPPPPPPSVMCNGSQIIDANNQAREFGLSTCAVDHLEIYKTTKQTPTKVPTTGDTLVGVGFVRKSASRDAVVQALASRRGWVKVSIVIDDTGLSRKAVEHQLSRLVKAGAVEPRDGMYRVVRQRKPRKLKPCSEKPLPVRKNDGAQRKTLSRSELRKRGWMDELIDRFLPVPLIRQIEVEGRKVQARYYRVDDIIRAEQQPGFEQERFALHRTASQNASSAITEVILKAGRPRSIQELAEATGIKAKTVAQVTGMLTSRGILVKVTRGRRRAFRMACWEKQATDTALAA